MVGDKLVPRRVYIYIHVPFVCNSTVGTPLKNISAKESAMPSVCYGESSCTRQSIASLLCRGEDDLSVALVIWTIFGDTLKFLNKEILKKVYQEAREIVFLL